MEVGARRMNRVLTELINNSGYFAVKYKAKVSPTFPPQVQLSEMAALQVDLVRLETPCSGC